MNKVIDTVTNTFSYSKHSKLFIGYVQNETKLVLDKSVRQEQANFHSWTAATHSCSADVILLFFSYTLHQ